MSKKISIKAKILTVMLLLTVVTFGLAAIFTLDNISRLGRFTLKSCDDLGEKPWTKAEKHYWSMLTRNYYPW